MNSVETRIDDVHIKLKAASSLYRNWAGKVEGSRKTFKKEAEKLEQKYHELIITKKHTADPIKNSELGLMKAELARKHRVLSEDLGLFGSEILKLCLKNTIRFILYVFVKIFLSTVVVKVLFETINGVFWHCLSSQNYHTYHLKIAS